MIFVVYLIKYKRIEFPHNICGQMRKESRTQELIGSDIYPPRQDTSSSLLLAHGGTRAD